MRRKLGELDSMHKAYSMTACLAPIRKLKGWSAEAREKAGVIMTGTQRQAIVIVLWPNTWLRVSEGGERRQWEGGKI